MTDNRQDKYSNPFRATLTGIQTLFKKQEPAGVLSPGDRLDGKTVLVDGASSGLGFAVAVDVARRGARLIMACRTGIPDKGELVKKLSGSGDVYMLKVDFSDIPSIHHLVDELKEKFGTIDILVCNAGIVPKQSRKTPQGLEEMFMVNYLSKFLFVNLLIEKQCFNRSADRVPRLVFVASESHRNPEKFEWESFGNYVPYTIGKSVSLYGYYKLLTTFTVELSRRLNPTGKTGFSVFALCPGPVNSNIAREAPKIFQPLMKLVFALFFRSPAKAAVPVVYLAASKDEEGKVWDYLFLMGRKEVDEKAKDPRNGDLLWKLSKELLKKVTLP
jgi:NAD(P)-dependent dehydrogenase (short-subunit alcohol dehydrogenase family)